MQPSHGHFELTLLKDRQLRSWMLSRHRICVVYKCQNWWILDSISPLVKDDSMHLITFASMVASKMIRACYSWLRYNTYYVCLFVKMNLGLAKTNQLGESSPKGILVGDESCTQLTWKRVWISKLAQGHWPTSFYVIQKRWTEVMTWGGSGSRCLFGLYMYLVDLWWPRISPVHPFVVAMHNNILPTICWL